jgi:hypothetical protein
MARARPHSQSAPDLAFHYAGVRTFDQGYEAAPQRKGRDIGSPFLKSLAAAPASRAIFLPRRDRLIAGSTINLKRRHQA